MTDPLTRHKQLMREMQRISDEVEKLEKDEAYQEAIKFKEDIDEVLKKHGKTEEDLLEMLAPPMSDEPRKKSSRKPKKSLPMKRYKNPHTQESLNVKTLKDPIIKPWIEKYGLDEVKGWKEDSNDKVNPAQKN